MSKKIKVNHLDKLMTKYIRLRDNYTCVFCGRRHNPDEKYGLSGCHNSHFWGRGKKSTRYDPENCDLLCAQCHFENESNKQGFYREWKIKQLGQERYDALRRRSNEVCYMTTQKKEEVRKYLEELINELA